jgi:D-cysteine desulfhydrase
MSTPPPIPRVELAYTPTPLLKLERLSADLGVELWVKRDDLTGLLETGGTVRKLEFLVGEALAQRADTLITCGAPQSDGCRAVTAVAARLGLRAMLALEGPPPAETDGNLLLDRLLGAEIRYCAAVEWEKVDQVMQEMAGRARLAGRAPYVIPEHAAGALGALGYVTCAQELAEQARHGAPPFDTITIPAASGASLAGLLIGRQLTGLRAEVVGIPVGADGARVRAAVLDAFAQAGRRFGLPVTPPAEVRLLDGAEPAGGPTASAETLALVVRVARREGLVLDPVHTARAFGALLERLRREPGSLGRRVCFVNTGGVFGVFPFRDALGRLADADVW